MHIGKHSLASLALAGLLTLGGCSGSGNSDAALFGGSVIPPGSTVSGGGATTNRSTFTIPSNGGTVALPPLDDITGSITFGAGAQPNTQMTLSVSTTPGPNSIPVPPPQGGLSFQPFYYMTVQVDRPFDLDLVNSISLTDEPDNKVSVPSVADQYNMPVAEVGGPVQQHLAGDFDPVTATFYNAQPLQMQPGKSYIMQAQSIDHPALQLGFKNDSEFKYAYYTIIGQNAAVNSTDPNFYFVDAQGQLTPFKAADRIPDTIIDIGGNTNPGKKAGYCNYSHPFPPAGTNISLPLMRAGRCFIALTNTDPQTVANSTANGTSTALGELLLIRTEDPLPPLGPNPADVNLSQPNGWGLTGDRNYKTLFDWVEFDYKLSPDSGVPGMGVNKTEVDMFGFGIQINLTGPTIGNATVGTTPGGRKLAFDAIEQETAFKTLLIPAANTTVGNNTPGLKYLRAIAPKQGLNNVVQRIAGGTFPVNYLDDYITSVWNRYKTDTLTVYTSAFGTYTGQVNSNDELILSSPTFIDLIFKKPSTGEALEPTNYQKTKAFYRPTPSASPVIIPDPPGEGAPAPRLDDPDKTKFPPYVATESISALSAAFNRSTLLLENFITRDYRLHPATLSKFYNDKDNNQQAQPVNHYARIIHAHSLPTKDAPGTPPSGGAAYAFGFDDNSNQSSFIGDNRQPTSMTLTVTKVNQ